MSARLFGFVLLLLGAVLSCGSTVIAAASYRVSGTVRTVAGQPAAGVSVKAYHKGSRGEKLLGSAVTNASGNYAIVYEPEPRTALMVRVFAAGGKPVAESATIQNAGSGGQETHSVS